MDATTDSVNAVNGKVRSDQAKTPPSRQDRRRFSTWLPEELLEQIRGAAEAERTSIQAIVETALQQAVGQDPSVAWNKRTEGGGLCIETQHLNVTAPPDSHLVIMVNDRPGVPPRGGASDLSEAAEDSKEPAP